MLENIDYNPDVLTCLANLSNDEVFTPPELVNDILDLLPKELFKSKETTNYMIKKNLIRNWNLTGDTNSFIP